MQAFLMIRDEDQTGLSGTGIVAEGVVFSDGRVTIRWQTHAGEHNSTVNWDGIDDVLAIHGHNGRTWLQFADDIVWPPADEGRPQRKVWMEEAITDADETTISERPHSHTHE